MAPRKRKAASSSGSVEAKKVNLRWKCDNCCERFFRYKKDLEDHVGRVHKCRTCWNIVKDSDKQDHAEMHKREKAEKAEAERKKKQFSDDFVEKFIRTKKLSEYQSDEELDFDYIFSKYRQDIDDETLLFFVKHGMRHINVLHNRQIIFLLENDAISVEEVADCMGDDTSERVELIEYFLEKNFAIEPSWVAVLIHDHALIERIKQRHNFTFEEIFEHGLFWDNQSRKNCYDAVHAQFPDPNYIKPIYKKFECIKTKHVDDYLQSYYHYDEEKDKLSIVVGDDEISLGRCRKMIENESNLCELIAEYRGAIEQYEEANKNVSEMFAQIDALTDDEDDRPRYDDFGDRRHRKSDYRRADMYRDVYANDLPDRNDLANIVSRTYFIIAKKPDTALVPTLEYLAMHKIANEKINFDHLPSKLKRKMIIKCTSKKPYFLEKK